MAFEISEFDHAGRAGEAQIQVAAAPPTVVHTTTGAKTLGKGTTLLRIKGTVSLTWGNSTVETFDSLEYRYVRPGSAITLA